MYITKKHLPRRTFLRGVGATLALPLLDAMIPAGTALAATAAAPKPRMGFFYFPHGAVMDRWTPKQAGRDFELPEILAPLAPFKQYMTVVTNLRNRAAESPAPHAITPGTWLGCVAPAPTHDPHAGTSADQVAAQHIGLDTPFPSLELCVEERIGSGNACDPNFGCSYSATIVFRTPTEPLPMEANPRKVFFRLFGQGDTAAERKDIIEERSSLLDLVSADASALKRQLGAQDRVMMDEYLDSVREIERQVDKLQDRDLSGLNLPEAPAGTPDKFEDHINLMFDLVALAYRANLTRIATMMMAAEVSMMTYPQIGIAEAFHPLSHHEEKPEKMARLARVQTYHSKIFARFIGKLAATPDGDGSLLDHSILLYGGNMSDSNLHNHKPLPSAVFGHGYGKIKGGQHLVYEPGTPLGNLLFTLMLRAGIPVTSHGDSTGELTEV